MKKDILHPKVVLNDEILGKIDEAFGPLVAGYTKDSKIKFVFEFNRAFQIIEFLRKNPSLLPKQQEIAKMILEIAPPLP